MADRPRFSRFRRIPGLFRTGDAKRPDPHEAPVPLTVYLPGRLLDIAENLAARHGASNVQEYCEELLKMSIEEEEANAQQHALQVTHGTLESLDELANDPEYLAAWSSATRETNDEQIHFQMPQISFDGGLLVAACDVVFQHAGLSKDTTFGLLPSLRRGETIAPEFADELITALLELENGMRETTTLDRKLAYALHRIAFEGQVLLTDSPSGAGNDLASTDRLHQIQEAVDRVLSGDDIRYYSGS